MVDLRPRLQAALGARYVLERELGRGGMAIVYQARDLKHDRPVALKVLRPEVSSFLGPDRFLQEIKLAAGLAHPNILPLHDSGDADGLLYYVMPYVAGESLRHRLEREGRLPLDEALAIAREVADALDYAHRQNIVHRDIKPENVLLEAGHAVVADFGIARAISAAAGGTRMTSGGIAVGTPDYMSPEQASGSGEADGRSDIYSLGCVLYEMLAGHAPFGGLTAADLAAGRRRAPLRALTGERPEVPVDVELAVETALATRPEDRFVDAAEFARALVVPALAPAGARRLRWRLRVSRHGWRVAGAVAATAVAAGLVLWRIAGAGTPLDPQRFVILPFAENPGLQRGALDGHIAARLLHQGFARWDDVSLADPMRVSDALVRWSSGRAHVSLDLEAGLEIARALGAGRLVRGELWQFRDTTFVTAGVYDVAQSGRVVRTVSARLPSGAPEGAALYRLADSLLLPSSRPPAAVPTIPPTLSLRALAAHEEGHRALESWELGAAADGFRRAVGYDSTFAHAYLELAQVQAWADAPVVAWRDAAARAARLADRLVPRERLLAQALDAIAGERFREACERYATLLRRDSLDFVAWFGMGECRSRDHLVLRDARSPSGWVFRGSYHTAIQAYRRALELVPSFNLALQGEAFSRLPTLFFTERNQLRFGRPLPPDTGLFAAYPSLSRDTLAFVPHPAVDVLRARPGTVPPTLNDAVAQNQERLRSIVVAWTAAFSNSAQAYENLALALETSGLIDRSARVERSALAAIRRARSLARRPEESFRAGVVEVRVRLKLREFARARDLADSLLRARRDPEMQQAEALAGLAALTGRAHRAAALLAGAAELSRGDERGRLRAVALPVLEARERLRAYAALGAPLDSLTALRPRLDSLVETWRGREPYAALRDAVMEDVLEFAFPELGASAARRPGSRLVALQWALAHGDTAGVRRGFEELTRLRSGVMRPGDLAMHVVYHEAWLLLQVGDTSAAVGHLDHSLNALANLTSRLLEPLQAAGLVRAMALRAEVATRVGDAATARQWARAVAELWRDADPELQGAVDRLRGLTRAPR